MIENWNTDKADRPRETESRDPERDPIEALAEEYLDRLRRGESPDLETYTAMHPDLAEEIRELFPTLAMLEKLTPDEPQRTTVAAGLPSNAPAALGKYQICGEIGRGGMGIVYEAIHETMQRRVALKVLPKELASQGKNRDRFLRETRAAGNLHHTNIVPIFEVGFDQGLSFYAMQYIHGQNLDTVIDELRGHHEGRDHAGLSCATTRIRNRKPTLGNGSVAQHLLSGQWELPPEATTTVVAEQIVEHVPATADPGRLAGSSESDKAIQVPEGSEFARIGEAGEGYFRRVARVGLQVAEALHYAHLQGVLHRDIKPSNLLLDMQGVVWVTDFGLAKHEGDDFTHTGDIVGTLRYMAPERFQGQADVRSDLYSLGLTLYELCTFRYAFEQSDRAELIHQVTHHTPPPPRQINPRIPRDLETIILKSIDREPSHRYSSAEKMAEDLRLFVEDRPIQARRISLRERCWRWCRRNPAQAALTACIAVLLVVLAGVSLYSAYDSRQHAEELEAENQRVVQAEVKARKATQVATQALYESHRGRANAGRWSHRPGQHFTSLTALTEAAKILPTLAWNRDELEREKFKLRNEAIAAMPLVDVRIKQSWPVEKGWTGVVAFTSEYDRYAHSDHQGNITIRRVADNLEIQSLTGPGARAWILRFSPDGRFLAAKFHDQDTSPVLWAWELDSGRIVLECDIKTAMPTTMAFAADSQRLAVAGEDRVLRVFSLPEANVLFEEQFRGELTELCFNPEGTKVAVATNMGAEIVDVPAADQVASENKPDRPGHVVLQPARIVTCVAWNGEYISCGTPDGVIRIWDAGRPQRPIHELEGHLARVVQLNASHNGRLLFSRAWDGTSRLWDLGRASELLRMDFRHPVRSDFSPDDRLLGFGGFDTTFGIWEVALGGPLMTLGRKGQKTARWMSQYHPSIPHLLATATSQGVQFWNTKTGQLLDVLPSQYTQGVLFTPDGKSILTSGGLGLNQWPIELDPENLDAIQIGPRLLLLPGATGRASMDSSGRYVAVDAGDRHAMVVDLKEPAQKVSLAPHASLDRAVLSPDGRLVATATWQGHGVRIWDRATGTMLENLAPEIESAAPVFSPNGKWLAVGAADVHFLWNTETWECVHRMPREHPDGWPGHVAFSPDGKLVAFTHTRYSVQMLDVATGKQVAILEPPERQTVGWLEFSRDGRELSFTADDLLHIWNWDAIQRQLKKMHLD